MPVNQHGNEPQTKLLFEEKLPETFFYKVTNAFEQDEILSQNPSQNFVHSDFSLFCFIWFYSPSIVCVMYTR